MVARGFVGAMKLLAPVRAKYDSTGIEIVTIGPETLLGSPLESLYWKRGRAETWIRQGEVDAQAALHRLPDFYRDHRRQGTQNEDADALI
jgi:hypothetical protein